MKAHVCAIAALGICLASRTAAAAPTAVTPPGQPASGFGSPAGYISPAATARFVGNPLVPWAGDWCWYYQPRTLAHGDRAPVVIFLHGFALMAPEIYDRHIEHLTRQGYIVVFPQINKGGLLGILSDFDQNLMLDRAVLATRRCLDRLGQRAERDAMYLYGHSLGGLLAAVWASDPAAPPVRAVVLANPATDSFAGMPAFVADLLGDALVPIDYVEGAAATTTPVVILTGDADTIAPSDQALELRDVLIHAPSVVVYQARSDAHAGEGLSADHMAPIHNDGVMPDFLMALFGGTARTNAIDFRFYWAALDAVLAGHAAATFDMGAWSDGVPVRPVVAL